MTRFRMSTTLLLFVAFAQIAASVAQNGETSELPWSLANLGRGSGPPLGNSPYLDTRAGILEMAGEAARSAVNGSTLQGSSAASGAKSAVSSLVANTPGNSAPTGQTNGGLLVYRPASSTLDAVDFGNFFSQNYPDGTVKGIVLARGTYSVNNTQPNFHINLYCFNRPPGVPFELDFTGVTIYFGNYQLGGISFLFCSDFYFHGPFNFMYAASALPFSQGVIDNISPTGDGNAVYTVTTDVGYPTTTTGLGDNQGHLCVPYYANGTIVQNATDVYSGLATRLSARQYAFQANYVPTIVAGMKLAIRGNAGNHGVFLYKTVNFKAANLYIYTAPIFGILDTYGTNTTISNNVIVPWPYNIGNNKPLLSTNADGIHIVGGRNVGPSVLSNQVINSGDDAIAAHGVYYTVYSADPQTNSLVVFSPACGNSFCQLFQLGDITTVYSSPSTDGFTPVPGAFTSLGQGTVTNVQLLNPQPLGDGSANPNNHPGYPFPGDSGSSVYPRVNYNVGYYWRLTYANFPPAYATATKDSLITDTTASSNNFRVNSNYATNHRARSIHVKASNGTINNNVVQNPTIFGLLLAIDLFFLEGDFMQNVIINNNYIGAPLASLFQVVNNPVDGSVVITQNQKNLTYFSNVFDNAGTWAVALSSGSQETFRGNLIRNAGCYPFVYGLFTPYIPPGTLVYLAQMSNASIVGNVFQTTRGCNGPYGNYASPYYTTNVTFGLN